MQKVSFFFITVVRTDPKLFTSSSVIGNYEALSKYARDLTEAAEQGKLDPVIGRDEEIRKAIQILSRRTKNNPILLGTLYAQLSFIIVYDNDWFAVKF